MVSYLRAHPECDLVYSDEDKLDPRGRRIAAHLKPDWSPDLIDCCNYIRHLTVIRREPFDRAGGFRAGFRRQPGLRSLPALHRAREGDRSRARGAVQLANHEGSAAGNTTAKPRAYGANVRILEERLARSGEQGTVGEFALKGACHLRRAITGTR